MSRMERDADLAGRGSRVPIGEHEATVSPARMRADIRRLKPGDLARLYPASAAALRSRRVAVPPEDFDDRWKGHGALGRFLEDMGRPKRHENETVDRRDTHDPKYGPGLCRWAGHAVQAGNKTTGVPIYDPTTRSYGPRAEVARNNGLTSDAVRQRMGRGATSEHVVAEMLQAKLARTVRSQGSAEAKPEPEAQEVVSELIPEPPLPVARSARRRLPFPVTLAKREEWFDLYRRHRLFVPDEGFEWPGEFVLRYSRAQVRIAQDAMQRLQDGWGGQEPSAAEEEEWAGVERLRDHWAGRARLAAEALPGILHELRGQRREGAPWTFYGRTDAERDAAVDEANDRGDDDYDDDFDLDEDADRGSAGPALSFPLPASPNSRQPRRRGLDI